MQFVIVHNGFVTLGPKTWNKLMFEEELRDECEVEYTLPTRNNEGTPFVINANTKILKVVSIDPPPMNGKTQRLEGPFWNFTADTAKMSYTVVDLPIDMVKARIKEEAAAKRYQKEISGIKMTIQGQEVTVDTARGSRDIFLDTYNVMADDSTINWKFPEGWFTLSKAELGSIVAAGIAHIQACFDWEMQKAAEIDGHTALVDLDAVEVKFPGEVDSGLPRG